MVAIVILINNALPRRSFNIDLTHLAFTGSKLTIENTRTMFEIYSKLTAKTSE